MKGGAGEGFLPFSVRNRFAEMRYLLIGLVEGKGFGHSINIRLGYGCGKWKEQNNEKKSDSKKEQRFYAR